MLENFPLLSAHVPDNTDKILVDLSTCVEHLEKRAECDPQTVIRLQRHFTDTLMKVLGAFEGMFERAKKGTAIPLSVLLYEVECNWYRVVTENTVIESEQSVERVKETFHGFDDYDQIERGAITKLHSECEKVHTTLQWFFDNVGPSTMQRLPKSVLHIGIGKVADHFDEQKIASGIVSRSLDLSIGRLLLHDTTTAERRGFLTKTVIANTLKRFGQKMLLEAQEGHTNPSVAMELSAAMTLALHRLYQDHGDPVDTKGTFTSTI